MNILTLGLGSFVNPSRLVTLGLGSSVTPPTPPAAATNTPGFEADTPFVADLRVRRRLLEERLRQEAEQAVQDAARAEQALSEAIGQDVDIKPVLDARRIAQEAYLEAYRAEQIAAEEVLRQFQSEVAAYRLEIRRRAALILLLS